MAKKIIAITLIAILLIGVSGTIIISHYINKIFVPPNTPSTGKQPEVQQPHFKKPFNLMVIGLDQTGKERSRSDTIIIYHIDPVKNRVSLLTVPRDTYVNIPGRGMDKVNHAFTFGGIDLTRSTLEKFLGIKIEYYAATNFAGFANLINRIGGITVYVEKDIRGTNIKEGLQKLDGTNTLVYLRDRRDLLGDIARVKRQQKFMKALARDVARYDRKLKLLPLIPQLYNNIKTNLSFEDCRYLYALMKNMDSEKTEMAIVPGDFYLLNNISYWKPDKSRTDALVKELFGS